MDQVIVRHDVDAPADEVWSIIREFARVDEWGAGIESCEVKGDGVGATRTLRLIDGITLHERLDSIDDDARTLRYSVIDDHNFPFNHFRSALTVRHEGAQRCTLEWRSEFEAELEPKYARSIVRGIQLNAINGLNRLLHRRRND